MNTRTDWVDYAKAIGIIFVVFGHMLRGLFHAGIEMPEDIYLLVDSVVYSFHMPLFFFLSGLFFSHSYLKRGAKGLILNKVDTIVYPFLIWSILQGVTEVLMSNYTNGDTSFGDILRVWEPRDQFWFLYALFFIFVSSVVIFSIVSERYVAVVFILVALLYLNRELLPHTKTIGFIANHLVYFILGVMFAKYDMRQYIMSKSAFLVLFVAFILAQYLFHGYLGKLYGERGIEALILASISILFIVSLSIVIAKKPNRFFAYIGASSMAIYLLHIFAASGARIVLSKIIMVDSLSIHIVIGCLAGILIPLIVLKIINYLNIKYIFSAPISKWLNLKI